MKNVDFQYFYLLYITCVSDPKDASTSANAMYKNEMYPMALSNALGDNGILILAQSYETAASFSSKTEFSLVSLLYHLEGPEDSEDYWFQSFHVYEEVRNM